MSASIVGAAPSASSEQDIKTYHSGLNGMTTVPIGAEVNPRADIEMTYPGKYMAHRSSTSIHVQPPPPHNMDLEQSVYSDDEDNAAEEEVAASPAAPLEQQNEDHWQSQLQGWCFKSFNSGVPDTSFKKFPTRTAMLYHFKRMRDIKVWVRIYVVGMGGNHKHEMLDIKTRF